ncbi:hypothetical protein AJ87_44235 [Rhizobium yanglingense]|nr:hypothetical protein AJ87_44235 [Rhizobium yanglingense]
MGFPPIEVAAALGLSLIAYVYVEKPLGRVINRRFQSDVAIPWRHQTPDEKAPDLAEKTAAAHLEKAERARALRGHDRKSTGAGFN